MAGVCRSALVVAALLWLHGRGVSAGKAHFVERVIQSHVQEPQQAWQGAPEPSGDRFAAAAARNPRTRITRVRLPSSLGEALMQAMAHEANPSRWGRLRGDGSGRGSPYRGGSGSGHGTGTSTKQQPEQSSMGRPAEPRAPWSAHRLSLRPAQPRPLPGPVRDLLPFSDAQRHHDGHRTGHDRRLNITEMRAGCSCSGVSVPPESTLSFLVSDLPPPGQAHLDLHLPVAPSDPPSPHRVPLATRLAVCPPGGDGRSVPASLMLKGDPQRPLWRHALVSDELEVLLRGEEGQVQERCLLVVLPQGGPVTLDRGGPRLAHIVSRPAMQFSSR